MALFRTFTILKHVQPVPVSLMRSPASNRTFTVSSNESIPMFPPFPQTDVRLLDVKKAAPFLPYPAHRSRISEIVLV